MMAVMTTFFTAFFELYQGSSLKNAILTKWSSNQILMFSCTGIMGERDEQTMEESSFPHPAFGSVRDAHLDQKGRSPNLLSHRVNMLHESDLKFWPLQRLQFLPV